MGYRLPLGWAQFENSSGAVLSGAKLYVYENGTTTLAAIYSDIECAVPAANPIVADATGRFAFRFAASRGPFTLALKTSADVSVDSQDDVYAEDTAAIAGQFSNRNALKNGCCRVWQRGVGPFTSATTPANSDDTYLMDQCILLSDGNDIVDVSQETTTVPTGFYAAIKLDVETANKKFGLLFPVEARDAAALVGGNAVASFYARKGGSNATAETLRAAIISWQGTADSITSDVVSSWGSAGTNPTLAANWTYETTPQNLTLTTSFQRFDEADGLSGAIDSASTKQFALFVWLDDTDATVGDLLYLTGFQVEPGVTATPFFHRPFAEELALCERYYEKSYDLATVPGTAVTVETGGQLLLTDHNSALFRLAVRFRTRKRTAPTVTTWDAAGNAGKVTCFTGAAFVDNNALTTLGAKEDSFYAYHTTSSSTISAFAFAASAEL